MTSYFKSGLFSATLPITFMLSGQAVTAQETSRDTLFEPSFFEVFAPRTALDMVSRIPGFQIDSGDNRRGLGQGGANILVNGERLTGKTNVGSQLSRIVAENIVRIEIKDGASLDIPGLSGQVANLVTKSTGQSGTWSWAPEFRGGQKGNFGHAHLTVSGERGTLSYSLEVRNEANRNGAKGPEILQNAGGIIFEIRDERARYNFDGPGGTVDLTWKPKSDHIGNLNLEYNKQNAANRVLSSRRAQTPRGQDLDTIFTNGEDEWNAKIGADYEWPVGPGKLKMIGYYRFERSPTRSVFSVFNLSGTQLSGSIFDRLADEAETIARSEYSWSKKSGHDWTIGVEGAFNFLDIDSGLQELSEGSYIDVALDGASSRVEEKRAEATLTHSRPVTSKWTVQLSAGMEYSEIEQTGGLARNFIRPKGFLLATYKPDENTSIRFKAEREVGQLSFFDFISSIDVEDNLDRTGNVNLIPEQSWNLSTEYEKDFGQGFTLNINPYFNFISDLVDRVLIGEDGDAVGNVDSAVQYGVDFNTTIKGDRWGWNGTQFDLDLEWRDSRVDDPVTGISRQLSRDKKTFWHARMRHDIPDTQWAYGGGVREYADYTGFRIFTTDNPTLKRPITYGFIEHKDILGAKIKVEVVNILDSREEFTRGVFTDRRDRGVLDFTEFESRAFGPTLNIEFSGTF